jgi:hypothetical protein
MDGSRHHREQAGGLRISSSRGDVLTETDSSMAPSRARTTAVVHVIEYLIPEQTDVVK